MAVILAVTILGVIAGVGLFVVARECLKLLAIRDDETLAHAIEVDLRAQRNRDAIPNDSNK